MLLPIKDLIHLHGEADGRSDAVSCSLKKQEVRAICRVLDTRIGYTKSRGTGRSDSYQYT